MKISIGLQFFTYLTSDVDRFYSQAFMHGWFDLKSLSALIVDREQVLLTL